MFYISKRAAVMAAVIAGVGIAGVIGITTAVASADATVAGPTPAVTITVTADPLPAVTVTADPLPAATVTVTVTKTTVKIRNVTADPLPAVTVTKRVTAGSPKRAASFSSGTWKVGSEIPAGTYVTTVAKGEHCYYARLAGFSGELDDIVANDNYEGPARGRVTISPSDAGIEFSGDCEWIKS